MMREYSGFLLCALLCCLMLSLPAAAGDGEIAFDYQQKIWVMDEDGGIPTQLAPDAEWALNPAWSPNGTRIVFDAELFGGHGLWLMMADGSYLHNLNFNPGQNDLHPAWSPDGTKIAYTHFFPNGEADIYMMNAGGGGQVRLTDEPGLDYWPTWSPDSTMIAFVSHRAEDEEDEIYVMNAVDPTKEFQWTFRLTDTPHDNVQPAWSPDGTKIAFVHYTIGALCSDIYVVDAQIGSIPVKLTSDPDHLRDAPAWSPDGGKIIFTSDNILTVMASDGSNPTPLGNNQVGYNPSWWGPPEQGVIPLPGESGNPTDPDDDGLHEDLNANNQMDYDDAVILFWNVDWISQNEPVSAFDFNGNGIMDYDDAVTLFWEI